MATGYGKGLLACTPAAKHRRCWLGHRLGWLRIFSRLLYSFDRTTGLTQLRILATRLRQDCAAGAAATQLRAQGVAALRNILADGETARRYIYEGVLSREQAARGAVIGQYVRIAQSEVVDPAEPTNVMDRGADFNSVRRDLMESMLQQMMGAGAEPVRGAHVMQII